MSPIANFDPADIAALDLVLQLVDLRLEEIALSEPQHCDDGEFHYEVDECAENDEVVQAPLPVLHLVREPVRHPVEHPEQVHDPRNEQKHNKLELIFL